MATGPVYDQGGIPRVAVKGDVAVRLDTGGIERWNAGTTSWVALAPQLPVGSIIVRATANPPSGTLLCDGLAVPRLLYAALFAEIGVTWGPGDGVTTFNLPDFRDRFLQMFGPSNAIAGYGGAVAPTVLDPGHPHILPAMAPGAAAGPFPVAMAPGPSMAAFTGITVPDGRPPYGTVAAFIVY